MVRRLFAGLTYVPSCSWAAPVMPVTGELIVQYDRLSFAASSWALASSTPADADRYLPLASSRSFWDSASWAASGFVRSRSARATSRLAWWRARAAAGASSWTWKGLASIRKRTSPSLTMPPSV